MGKVFSSVLAARLSSWANINNRLSPFQKGFRESEGCVEHNFLLEQAIVNAKRSRSDLALAWLDLENALGSIPHSFILKFLHAVGVPSSVSNIILSLYTGASSEIRCGAGWTPPISMEAGESLQIHLDSLVHTAARIGLRFTPPKCASLTFYHARSARVVNEDLLSIFGTPIPSLTGPDAYKYLGLRVGLNFYHNNSRLFDTARADILKVRDSLLAPWQKLHAIRSIILPRLDFTCRNAHVRKSQTQSLDKTIVSTAKHVLHLPSRSKTTIVHLACSKGGAALPLFRDLLDVQTIGHAFRSLSSSDAMVSDVARACLVSVVHKKTRVAPDHCTLADFLNGSTSGRFIGESSDYSTVCSRARHATQRLCNKIRFEWAASEATDSLVLNVHRSPNPVSVAPSAAKIVVRILRNELEASYIAGLYSLPDQGKTIGAVSLLPASNHLIQAGHYTRFCDWNFIHRARLGVLQLNATKRFGRGNPCCRKCGYARETIPHVLNHCKVHSSAWKGRHDAIQNRIKKAIPSYLGSVTINKKFPGVTPTLIPDLVLRKKSGETVIVDFTVAFEDRYDSLVTARNNKVTKYQPILESLRATGEPAFLDAIVVGSLGSWDPANDSVLLRLGISRKYSNLMWRLICSDVIRWSRDIYIEHLTGKRQY
ncbi:reverse transcriptase domain-containing protein [Trichonephila clavata]|uniref:Reverse transcriptase domain-containing protein n=1 Tax=Trichonephila clavata TaxID=2740835 RepID=A0A8X6FTG5_TRICU|nr:reverse transcriptase domain-containing protein [Trichonephila clavata]